MLKLISPNGVIMLTTEFRKSATDWTSMTLPIPTAPTRRRTSVLVAGALAVALAGCSLTSSDGDEKADSSEKTSSTTQQDYSKNLQNDDTDSADAGVAEEGDVVAKQDVKVPGSSGDTATIGVQALKVNEKVQVLRLIITPHFDSESDSETISVYDVWGSGGSFNPRLVDMTHLKVYSPIRDGVKRWTTDAVDTKTTNGKPVVVWAVFAAPEDDVDSFDVRLQDSWPQFTDVPVKD